MLSYKAVNNNGCMVTFWAMIDGRVRGKGLFGGEIWINNCKLSVMGVFFVCLVSIERDSRA